MANPEGAPSTGPVPERPIIAVTMGDAAGVGPELCLHLLEQTSFSQHSVPLVIGCRTVLEQVAQRLGRALTAPVLDKFPERLDGPAVLDLPEPFRGVSVAPGRVQAACGSAAARFIEAAAQACKNKTCAAMVTCPISKSALNLAGIQFPGHTEMIASLTGARDIAMLLYSEKLAVTFATMHQSLRSVPEALNVERICRVATLLNQNLRLLRTDRKPRLAILGLNPHAGEDGLFGDEEVRIIKPAVQRLLNLGLDVEGPLPPDTGFTPQALQRFDGHVALYHDQGSIPFKMFAFDSGVNVTLGLEIVRTSPDHGTAYDIAWQGKARPDSFMSAYALAARLAIARFRHASGRKAAQTA
ncbi:MAG: 4-hydroxythreonine-4-phosphate dehydrogenase PdxA [Planctomycetota bacterium]|nr:4-hydroxythreonine-4-phosphate dehydrogenase PdxA [Planctomycetota bacterium]